MGRADKATIESGVPGEILMDRAGRAVARAAIRLAGGRYGKRALVLCGPGNNGGDGFVCARVLASEGLGVTCMVTFDPAEAKGDAKVHLDRMQHAGIHARPFDPEVLEGRDVYVDALLGTGFSGSPRGIPAQAIAALSPYGPVVSVDIPSGVDGATGTVGGDAVEATLTVAIAAEKIGTALPPGSIHAGTVEVVDIGIEIEGGWSDGPRVEIAEADDVALALGERSPETHKRTAGSVAILAGSGEIHGAALLSARGAVRMGAGYVTLGTTSAVKGAASVFPELLVHEVSESAVLGPDALDAFAEVIERADALAIGPGIGTGDEQRALIERVLAEIDIPVVLDADALNVLAADTTPLEKRTAPAVITPHPGELGRLLGRSTDEVSTDRLAAALEASRRFPSAVVVAKGNRTVIASGDGTEAVVIPTGGPELATAGTGDVLTGALAACLARSGVPGAAAMAAAYVHGLAGTIAGKRMGPSGVAAGDVAEALPAAVEAVRRR
ncbi:MAG: NAD(P)H-hydrate dehydratase [Actinobacteria bacterium]|nr:NAD(P)H-hydrate dehydratase [Actinomycetota bacterium]